MCTLYESISSLCREKGIKGGKMCTDLGLSKSLMTDLKAGRKKSINTDTAEKIAAYFGVTVDRVLGKEKAPTDDDERRERILRVAKVALFGGDTEVTDEMWQEAVFAAELIKQRHNRKKD